MLYAQKSKIKVVIEGIEKPVDLTPAKWRGIPVGSKPITMM